MKLIRTLLTLIGAFTAAGAIAGIVLFFFAPTLLQQEDKLEKADAIVILGGQYYRPVYGAELYNAGYAPKVLVSKPVVLPEEIHVRTLGINFPYQWEVYKDILLTKGVPEEKIEFFGEANISTFEEAEQLRQKLGPETKSIILVTSPLHTRRAGTIFRDMLPKNMKIIVISTPYDKIADKWWTDFRDAPFTILEIAKTIYYELGGGFRSKEQLADQP